MMVRFFRSLCQRWVHETCAMAAIEASLIFPVLLIMLLGTFDTGYGILAGQKTIRAAQVTADLIARNRQVGDGDVNEAIQGGRLALVPFDADSYGVDIQSIEFDDEGNVVQLWCETQNMAANGGVLNDLGALSIPGEGVIVVTARYDYEPLFAGFIFDTISFQEIAFARGRLTSTVTHENGSC